MSENVFSEILDRSNEVAPEYPADNLIDFQKRQAWLVPAPDREGYVT